MQEQQNSAISDKPFMDDHEVEAICGALRLFHHPITALEWGSGNSTTYFHKQLRKGSKWFSIEHDPEWAEISDNLIKSSNATDIYLHHVPADEPWSGLNDGTFDEFKSYILLPTSLDKKFKIVFVDGRARVECMQIGWMLLDNSGIMILHDAQRVQYRRGIPLDCHYVRITNPHIDIDGNISTMFMTKSVNTAALLVQMLRSILPKNIKIQFDDSTAAMLRKKLSWRDIAKLPTISLYAGDIPNFIEYNSCIGLSLEQNDFRHIKHDVTKPFPLPEDSVDSFQSEDVFEHISYAALPAILDEIYRVLKPGGYFRLSLPDYGCDVLSNRSLKDESGRIVFDPDGGGTRENPGHLWFPRLDAVKELLEKSQFSRRGEINFLHYYEMDGSFVAKSIDYSKGNLLRTPDFEERVQNPFRPMSLVVDLVKG